MSETSASPNNKSIAFGRKGEREMTKQKKRFSPQLRQTAKHAIKRGMISAKAAKKHLGAY